MLVVSALHDSAQGTDTHKTKFRKHMKALCSITLFNSGEFDVLWVFMCSSANDATGKSYWGYVWMWFWHHKYLTVLPGHPGPHSLPCSQPVSPCFIVIFERRMHHVSLLLQVWSASIWYLHTMQFSMNKSQILTAAIKSHISSSFKPSTAWSMIFIKIYHNESRKWQVKHRVFVPACQW